MKSRLILVAAVAAAAALGSAGCAVVREQQSVGSYVDDAAITARVKAKFAESEVVGANAISVETLQGVVQLSGFAKSDAERMQAEKLARDTKGVVDVKNDVLVR
jgi:hyperosmotically inducible periplasmic protein